MFGWRPPQQMRKIPGKEGGRTVNRLKAAVCRLAKGLVVLAAALSLSGCSLGTDVEGLMRPPRSVGEQEAIQSALEAYLNDVGKGGSSGGYTLKYPKSGEYRSAFILKDFNGDGEDEALALYQPGPETGSIHINLLRKADDGWLSVSDIEGAGNDVEEVMFGDLNADGVLEVIVGWNIYNVNGRQLTLYTLSSSGFVKWYDGLYSSALVTDLTADGRDDLLVLQTGSAEQSPSATLWSAVRRDEEEVFREQGTVSLDSTIQQFRSIQTGQLSENVTGVYIDGERVSGGLVTELVYWDGTRLFAPFYDETTGFSQISYRDAKIPCMDVDGDGTIEWPSCRLFPGEEEAGPGSLWKTDWLSWSYESGTASRKFSSVVNLRDEYLLRLDDSWDGKISADYDKEESTLRLYDITDGQETILALRTNSTVYRTEGPAGATTAAATTSTANTAATTNAAGSSGTGAPTGAAEEEAAPTLPGGGSAVSNGLPDPSHADKSRYSYQLLEKREDGTTYEVWFSTKEPFNLTMEYIRYMFIFLQ